MGSIISAIIASGVLTGALKLLDRYLARRARLGEGSVEIQRDEIVDAAAVRREQQKRIQKLESDLDAKETALDQLQREHFTALLASRDELAAIRLDMAQLRQAQRDLERKNTDLDAENLALRKRVAELEQALAGSPAARSPARVQIDALTAQRDLLLEQLHQLGIPPQEPTP